MIGKTIPYQDLEGNPKVKTFYFSINQTEFAALNNRLEGGLENYVKKLMDSHDETKLLDLIMLFIVEGYGIRESSDDFIKEDAQGRKLGMRFRSSEACDKLLEELLDKENNIWAFIIGMLPASQQAKVKANLDSSFTEEGVAAADAENKVVPINGDVT